MWGVSICIIPMPVFVSFHCEYLYYSIASVWCIYQLFRAKESPSAARDGAQLYYIGKHNSASVTPKTQQTTQKQKGNTQLHVLEWPTLTHWKAQLCLNDLGVMKSFMMTWKCQLIKYGSCLSYQWPSVTFYMFRFYIWSKPIVRAVHSLTCIMRPMAILILSKGEALWVITKISAFATFRCHQRKRILKSGSLMVKQSKQKSMAKKNTGTFSYK